jgi:glycosyltransferase involved in cell wall biosynthesis
MKEGGCGMSDEIAVVIPAYNEAATIREVATGALEHAARVIVVDDCSSDDTSGVLAGVPVEYLRNEQNLGKAAALHRGFRHALDRGAEAVITLDGDGQHSVDEIPRLIALHRQHPRAIILASRPRRRTGAPRARYYANRFADFWIGWAAGTAIADSQSGFRLYPGELLRSIEVDHSRAAGFVFESEILIAAARAGWPIESVPVAALYPPSSRRSHFRPVIDILRIGRMVAWKLVSRGMYPQGLIRSLQEARCLSIER